MKFLIIVFTFLCLAVSTPAFATPMRVQENSTNSALTTTQNTSFSTPSTAGNLLIAVLTTTGTVNTGPSGFLTVSFNTNADGYNIYLYERTNAPSTTTINTSLLSNGVSTLYIAEYSGILSVNATDVANQNSASSPPVTSGNVSTTQANELLVAAFAQIGGSAYSSPTNGFAIVDQQFANSVVRSAYCDQIVSSTFNSNCGFPSNTGNGLIGTFIASPPISASNGSVLLMSN